jgi:nitroreductase
MDAFDLKQIDRLLTTTRAVRRRLDLERPVGADVLRECIGLATQAPNASNQQTWKWVVVVDPELRRKVGEEYRRIIVPPVEALRKQKLEAGDEAGVRISDSVLYLAERMGQVPAQVIPCFDFRVDASTHLAFTARMFASIYPAVWSFQLALRSRGLGSVLTTAHLLDDAPLQRLLRIPPRYTQTCLIPVAYTVGTRFEPARRLPVEHVIEWNGWNA